MSTAFHGRFHVFVVPVANANGSPSGEAVRITEEHDSGLPRYYYSRFDQYLSPTWSPDGKELILISNRGDVWGSGDLWRMEARPGAAMRMVRKEETNWKARPDWARDGKRVVYSSYLGRQRNQLWLTTAEGGDPFELTYCECDHTRPRWSPDGRRIAFVSNEAGNVSLRVVTIPGGAVETIAPATRRRLRPTGTLRITVTDGSGAPMPARLSVTGEDGRGWAPDDAWRHADDGFDRKIRPFEITYFHANGAATLTLPAGKYKVLATRGLEYAAVTLPVTVMPDVEASAGARLERLLDLPGAGWWSGDLHVHMNYGGTYRADPATLRAQAEAEDLHVVENLIVNKEQRIPDIAMFRAELDPVSTPTLLLKHDEEYHTSWWGHTGHLGLTSHVILPNYAGYANTPAASLFPDNATIADLTQHAGRPVRLRPSLRSAGARSGRTRSVDQRAADRRRARQRWTTSRSSASATTRPRRKSGIACSTAASASPPASGTDAMTNYASLRGPVGMNRVFVHSGATLDYRGWLAALKAGRTFVSNGPVVSFSIDGKEPGDEISLPAGPRRLTAKVSLRSIVPIEKLEIVSNGAVVATIPTRDRGTSADAEVPLPIAGSAWFTLRAWSPHAEEPILDIYPFATTSPIYVTVNGRPIRNSADARYFQKWIERVEAAATAHPGWNDAREKDEVLARLAEAKAVFAKRDERSRPLSRGRLRYLDESRAYCP